MRTVQVPASTLVVLLIVASLGAAQERPSKELTCEAVYVAALGGGREAPTLDARGQVFRTLATNDLEVLVVVPAAEYAQPAGNFEVRLTTPNGYHYGSYPIAVGDPRTEKERVIDGYRVPVKVQAPSIRALPAGRTAPVVAVRVPVAGSDIISSGLYGTWRLEILGPTGTPCAKSELTLER